MKPAALIQQLDALLPQTQCTRCGYPGCEPYAAAIVAGDADINQCPPGGDAGVAQLAALLQVPAKPLNPAFGAHAPRQVAWVDESVCIGCTLCLQACPVDAIVGASKALHTVLAEECTGCELCIAPCPVDCIHMQPATVRSPAHQHAAAQLARQRFQHRKARLAQRKAAQAARLAGLRPAAPPLPGPATEPQAAPEADAKAARIAAIMARARQRLEGSP